MLRAGKLRSAMPYVSRAEMTAAEMKNRSEPTLKDVRAGFLPVPGHSSAVILCFFWFATCAANV